MLELDDIAPLRGPRPPGAARVKRRIPPAERTGGAARRSVLGGIVAVGSGIGLTALGIFPPARKAIAGSYDFKGLPCPSYAASHNCSPGCGPSPVCANGECCWPNKHVHRGSGKWRLRPNQCYGGVYDGWLWSYTGQCGSCSRGVTYRCHDGYYVSPTTGHWWPTICRWRMSCR
jgi:hypothetical protein